MSAKLNAELIQFIEYFNLIKMVNRDTFWSWLMNRLSEIKESGAAALWRYCLKIYAGLDMMSIVSAQLDLTQSEQRGFISLAPFS